MDALTFMVVNECDTSQSPDYPAASTVTAHLHLDPVAGNNPDAMQAQFAGKVRHDGFSVRKPNFKSKRRKRLFNNPVFASESLRIRIHKEVLSSREWL